MGGRIRVPIREREGEGTGVGLRVWDYGCGTTGVGLRAWDHWAVDEILSDQERLRV